MTDDLASVLAAQVAYDGRRAGEYDQEMWQRRSSDPDLVAMCTAVDRWSRVQADVFDRAPPGGSFDVVFASFLYSHVPPARRRLRDRRQLRRRRRAEAAVRQPTGAIDGGRAQLTAPSTVDGS